MSSGGPLLWMTGRSLFCSKISVYSPKSAMEVVVSDRSSQPSRLRFVCVAATLAFCISAILFLTVPRVVLEAANSKAHVGTAGVWNHDEFRAKKIWLHGTTSIHSPAEEAVQAALKETERVSPFLSFPFIYKNRTLLLTQSSRQTKFLEKSEWIRH